MRKIKVLVACGAGIATSTVVMRRIEDLLQENKIDANVEQIKIAEAVSKQEGADMLISTTILPTEYKIPAITALGYISGVGADKLDKKILEIAQSVGKEG
ncbi:PTS sugar transporter subunit IIB [Enterococcus dongliensis]|uniref:PTS sugar transporter subunit IIB n=1 Tax=Enterococcus dongliensis TaxID=2559925 RepID=A0AAW8TIQ6_9ENTE|nr:PTS sugar transporter subunit IIB [Enterococcus dongliensis]MDT2596384.1 PTS sugar transporter subunit IIB [Enterococcus dongliensis]MDT2603772.1 PTS sugar transporter subunit IIB [Enterococcus dongliensis]MDT2634075.1 PTS sugar transporter subunit IIB [Enterococcus dongliensis]MDT2637005.1 PTS sugar transporter subunit IIB [Enterococcus dongliensis]MDT2642290.1 PTS sugar transporter subunit IIB [Enterococcus dongliensis]